MIQNKEWKTVKTEGRGQWKLYALCFFLGAAAMLCNLALVRVLPGQEYCLLEGDMAEVYVPAIRSFFQSLRSGEPVGFSWSYGLGMNVVPYSAFSAYSVFNIFFLLFPEADAELLVALVIILKTGAAASAFGYFAKRTMKLKDLPVLLWSLLYAMSGFQVSMDIINFIWMDAVILLPLLIAFLICFLEEGRWKLLLFSYAYLFLSNFYMGYMAGIFSLLFGLGYYFCYLWPRRSGRQRVRHFLTTYLRFAGIVFLAAGLCAWLLLPAAYSILTGRAPDATELDSLNVNVLDVYNQLFVAENNGMEGVFPYIYCGLLSVLLLPFYVVSKDIPKKEKLSAGIVLGILTVSCICRPLYLFWHAFDSPDSWGFRFAFLIAFMLCAIGARTFGQMRQIDLKKLLLVVSVNIGIYYIAMIYQPYTNADYAANDSLGMIVNILFLAAWFLMLWLYGKEADADADSGKRRTGLQVLFLLLCFCEVLVNGYFAYYGREDTSPSLAEETYRSWYTSMEKIEEELSGDDSFYRVIFKGDIYHDSDAFWGYCGVSDLGTFENYTLRSTMASLGIYAAPRVLYAYGYTPFTELLLGVKYRIEGQTEEDGSYRLDLTEDENGFAAGFLCSDAIAGLTLDSSDVFENNNAVASALLGKETELFTPLSENEISVYSAGIGLYETEDGYLLAGDTSVSGLKAIQYAAAHEDGRTLYCAFETETNEFVTTAPYFYLGEGNEIYREGLLGMNYIRSMIRNQEEDTVTVCMDDTTAQTAVYRKADFYALNEDVLEEIRASLERGMLEVESYGDGYLLGTVTSEEGGMLFTSVPYVEGWSLTVNGEPAEITPVLNGAFIGCELAAGENEIELTFTVPYAKEGWMVSGVSAVILAAVLLLDRRKLQPGRCRRAGVRRP